MLQILVYRGGAMARLGHNHVIASHHLSGVVYLTDDPLATRFDIQLPVNELTVDEPALREAAGADFPPGVPQSARDGTRTNLLSAALLDGSNYPTIRLRATDIRAAGEGFDAGVEVTLKDLTQVLRVPVQVQRGDGTSWRAGSSRSPSRSSASSRSAWQWAASSCSTKCAFASRCSARVRTRMGAAPIS